MKRIYAAAIIVLLSAVAASAEPERIYGITDRELEMMSDYLSSFTLAGITDVADARQMTHGEIVRVALAACARDDRGLLRDEGDGSVSVLDMYTADAADRLLSIGTLDRRTARDEGRTYYHDRLRYRFVPSELPTGPRASVRRVYRDGGLLLMTGRLVDAAGREQADFYAHVKETGRRGARVWTLRSILRSRGGMR